MLLETPLRQPEQNRKTTYVKYAQLHRLVLFFRYTALIALWATFAIFLGKILIFGTAKNPDKLSLEYVVICSIIMFWSAIFSHHILEWDHLITSLRYPNGRWRCHCNRCHFRRRHGNISVLQPRGLHRVLANRHTWAFVPAVASFFMMLLSTDASWRFLISLVVLFAAGDVVSYCVSKKTVMAYRRGLNEPLRQIHQPESSANRSENLFFDATKMPLEMAIAGANAEQLTEIKPVDGDMQLSMNRIILPDGKQRITGWIKTTFSENERQKTQHIPFCPAFENLPQASFEPEGELDVTIDAPVIMLHGMRFDVKQTSPQTENDNNSITVHFVVEDRNTFIR
ncbi:MAG: hypothetical protein LBT05_03105 [Planctomycetaceae bacterium]|jgi:hypothetical protein|nr:hypothetical protein [Planctomycetaceae bacterium]